MDINGDLLKMLKASFLFVLAFSYCAATPTLDHHNFNQCPAQCSGTPPATTITINATAGTVVHVFIQACANVSCTTTNVSTDLASLSDGTNTYVSDGFCNVNQISSNWGFWSYHVQNFAGSSPTLTITFASGKGYYGMPLWSSWTGLATSSVFDVSACAGGSGTGALTVTTGNISLSNSLVLATGISGIGTLTTAGSGYTLLDSNSGANQKNEYGVLGTSGSGVTATINHSTNSVWGIMAVVLKPSTVSVVPRHGNSIIARSGAAPSNAATWTYPTRLGYPEHVPVTTCFDATNNVSFDHTNGYLLITADKVTETCHDTDLNGTILNGPTTLSYTSGKAFTTSFYFLYGVVAFRAKFTGGSGPWPAIWMWGTNCQNTMKYTDSWNIGPCPNFDATGYMEFDMAEILNSNLTHVNQQIHVAGPHDDGCTATTTDVSANWHVYQFSWSSGSAIWQIDGSTTCTVTQSYIPNVPMFLVIDLLVGSCCGGTINDATLPQTMSVDYVYVCPVGTTLCDSAHATIFKEDFN